MSTHRRIIVQWQDSETRTWVPVAELLAVSADGRQRFEFGYLQGVVRARSLGFQPFMAFPEIDRRYASDQLFPFFQNRVMPTTRPDYLDYVSALGLRPETADVVDLLGRSEGRRQTDRIETVLVGEKDPGTGNYVTHFLVRAVRHVEEAETVAAELHPGDALEGALEPSNAVNPRARKLLSHGRALGYVPDYLVADLDVLESNGASASYVVVRVNPPPAPAHHRVLVRLEAEWPANFRPFSGPAFDPVSLPAPQATTRCA